MPAAAVDLAQARILISNDDGIHAPGLKVLERVARRLAKEVWVVAPETEQSAASHSLTMRRPLYLRQVGRRRYTVDGTPTDCVLIAIHQVMKDRLPDLVLSGVNHGGNLGEDATYSGTVAAAMEGTLLGIRAMALSQVYLNGTGRVSGPPPSTGRPRCCSGSVPSPGRRASCSTSTSRQCRRRRSRASRSPSRAGTRSAAR